MAYYGVDLHNSITLGRIFSIHYFEYMSNFKFSGEAHNFWEFVYIDKGEAGITHNKSYTVLHKGELFFHKPNEFHSVRATGTIAPNLIVISFECNDKAMNFFNNRRMKIDETAQTLLANIIIEAKRCFNCRLDDPYLQNMPLKDTDIFGSQQMIRLYLEHFLIHLIRCYSQSFLQHKKLSEAKLPKATKTNNDTETFNKIIDYLNRHITSHVTIDLICKDNLIGRSQLQKLFKEQCNRGIIEYFSILKIEVAKELIRKDTGSDIDADSRLDVGREKGQAEIKSGEKIRIVFSENSAFEPVIANLILTFGEPVNILKADTKNVGGVAKGEMILEFMEGSTRTEMMKQYLKEKGLAIGEVTGYVGS